MTASIHQNSSEHLGLSATLQCLCELLEEAEHNAQVKAVVLTGNSQCFAAGAGKTNSNPAPKA
jgi:hypothetical protein